LRVVGSFSHGGWDCLLLFGELVGDAMTLLEMLLGVKAIESSSSFGMEIRTVAGVKVATGVKVAIKGEFLRDRPEEHEELTIWALCRSDGVWSKVEVSKVYHFLQNKNT
jgi:hypothetical protein